MFLSSTAIPDLMAEYADVVKLGIFGHTHMDEDRLLERGGGLGHATADSGVAVKVIPSITPVHGNKPSFTVASVSPTAASIKDYSVIEASNLTGDDTKSGARIQLCEGLSRAGFFAFFFEGHDRQVQIG